MARSFNGTSDVITLTSSATINPAGSYSISVWFKPSSLPNNYNKIMGVAGVTGSNMFIGFSSSAKLSYYFNHNTSVIDPGLTSLTSGTWFHVAVLYNTTAVTLTPYVNGVQDVVTPAGFATAMTYSGASTLIGGSNYFPGSIADFAIWNVILSTAEVSSLAKGARPYTIRPASLGAYLPLDGLQSPEPDLSGNKNNGTLTGTAFAAGPPVALFTPRWPIFGVQDLMSQIVT